MKNFKLLAIFVFSSATQVFCAESAQQSTVRDPNFNYYTLEARRPDLIDILNGKTSESQEFNQITIEKFSRKTRSFPELFGKNDTYSNPALTEAFKNAEKSETCVDRLHPDGYLKSYSPEASHAEKLISQINDATKRQNTLTDPDFRFLGSSCDKNGKGLAAIMVAIHKTCTSKRTGEARGKLKLKEDVSLSCSNGQYDLYGLAQTSISQLLKDNPSH